MTGRVAAVTERARSRLRSAQNLVQEARGRSRGVDTAFNVQDRDRAVGGNLLACAIAYRVFLWLLPLALLIAAGLGFAQAAGSDRPAQWSGDIGLAKGVIQVVADAAAQAKRSRLPLLALALFGLYTAGGAGAKTLIAVHRFAWGLPPARIRAGVRASLAFTGISVGVVAISAGAQVVRRYSPGLGMTVTLVIAVAYAALWLGASLLLPHADAPWTRLLPGAVFVGVGSQVVHLVSVVYLSGKIESASQLYGGLGFAATLLLGLYLLSRLIVGSAVLNAALWQRAQARRETSMGPEAQPRADSGEAA